jgi:hypothetical protein
LNSTVEHHRLKDPGEKRHVVVDASTAGASAARVSIGG